MSQPRTTVRVFSLFFLLALTGLSQPVITDVFNAANRIPKGFPSHGVAQGSIFAIRGSGLGPTDLLKAGFPLPASDGLGGVMVKLKFASKELDAILIFVSDAEIGAILPSEAPLGDGVVTVSYNGATKEAPIKVIPQGFGMFSAYYFYTQYWAAAFASGDGGATSLSNIVYPVSAGQRVKIIGTGLGAIQADETAQGATGNPDVAGLKIFVGTKEAEIVSAGRGDCCDGLPEEFPLPRGVAGLDVIEFVVPEGVPGCNMTLTVQKGSMVSNVDFLAVADDSGKCRHVNNVGEGEVVTVGDKATVGNINMLQTISKSSTGGLVTEVGTEIATAQFIRFKTNVESFDLATYQWGYLADHPEPGSCIQQSFRTDPSQPPPVTGPPPPIPTDTTEFLDAGPRIVFEHESGRKIPILKNTDGKTYGGALGSSFSIPGISNQDNLFVNPEKVAAGNESGGADIPAFNVTLALPKPQFTWTNMDELSSIRRDSPLTVRWSGGDPNGYVMILGTSIAMDGTATVQGTFSCVAKVSAGSFTVPTFAMLGLPASGLLGPPPGISASNLTLQTSVAKKVDVPNTDMTVYSAIRMLIRPAMFQ